ncbi:MAG TPA: GNAT family N-acetyltransferase [Acholeplasmataceae bacterium]|nr:GNAT family N-acetyltransferase [Acholeplasmataceae bacterium]
MSIIIADKKVLNEWVKLSLKLFPECSYQEIYEEYQNYLTNDLQKEIGFLYQIYQEFVAFMNISIRKEYVNGTNTSPVLFIEAIYVEEKYRKQGIGKKLIKQAEEFARSRGIKQIASDCLIDNTNSEEFHKSCGFRETERVIFFVKEV